METARTTMSSASHAVQSGIPSQIATAQDKHTGTGASTSRHSTVRDSNKTQNTCPRVRGCGPASRRDVKRHREGRGVGPPVIDPNTCRSANRTYSRHTRERKEVMASGTGRCPQELLARVDTMQIQTRWHMWSSDRLTRQIVSKYGGTLTFRKEGEE